MSSLTLISRGALSRLIRAPGKVAARISRVRKERHCAIDVDAVLLPTAQVDNFSHDRHAISIGARTRVAGQLLVFGHGGSIHVGSDCFVGEGSRIWSASSISIGNHTLISHGVNIHDNDSHSISAASRRSHIEQIFKLGHPRQLADVAASPVVLEDDVWVGFNAVILKGVRIGRGSIIGAASVVTADVPPYSIMVGNPARCVGRAEP